MLKRIVTYRPSFTVRILAGLIALLVMLSVCTIVGISDRTGLNARANNFDGRSIEAGAKVYGLQCARCHGVDGEGIEGQGPALSSLSFVGRTEIKSDSLGQQSISTVEKSKRLAEVGWTGSLYDYVLGVTSAGLPVKTSNVWDVNHPTYLDRFGGPLREDQIRDVTNFIINWGLNPRPDDQSVLAPAPGAGGAPRPTAVPLTPEQEAGKAVYEKAGCTACHAIRGVGNQGAVGPNLSKIGADSVEIIASEDYKNNVKDQPAATTTEEYIRQSILHPNAFIVPKCPQGPCPAGVMPQIYEQQLKPDELNNLVSYLNSLK